MRSYLNWSITRITYFDFFCISIFRCSCFFPVFGVFPPLSRVSLVFSHFSRLSFFFSVFFLCFYFFCVPVFSCFRVFFRPASVTDKYRVRPCMNRVRQQPANQHFRKIEKNGFRSSSLNFQYFSLNCCVRVRDVILARSFLFDRFVMWRS